MSEQQREPKLGEIVLYTLPLHELSVDDKREFPAIITRVWGDKVVNLKVFEDHSLVPSFRPHVLHESVASVDCWRFKP